MSDATLETIEVAPGWRIRIEQETDGAEHANPRDDYGNLGVLFTPHERYNLGDHGSDEWDAAERAVEHFTEYGYRGGLAAFERWLKVYAGARVVLRVGMIDHSGLSMYVGGGAHWSDSAGWDSGTVGVIFDLPSTREERGLHPDVSDDEISQWLTEEVKAYDAYLRGDVVGYVVEHAEVWHKSSDPEEVRTEWEVESSCWGFLIVEHERDMAYVREQALAEVPDEASVPPA